jgi:hypothetical protein
MQGVGHGNSSKSDAHVDPGFVAPDYDRPARFAERSWEPMAEIIMPENRA